MTWVPAPDPSSALTSGAAGDPSPHPRAVSASHPRGPVLTHDQIRAPSTAVPPRLAASALPRRGTPSPQTRSSESAGPSHAAREVPRFIQSKPAGATPLPPTHTRQPGASWQVSVNLPRDLCPCDRCTHEATSAHAGAAGTLPPPCPPDPTAAPGPAAQRVDGPRTSCSLVRALPSLLPSLLPLSPPPCRAASGRGQGEFCYMQTEGLPSLYHMPAAANLIAAHPQPHPQAGPTHGKAEIDLPGCEPTKVSTLTTRKVATHGTTHRFHVGRIRRKTRLP